MFRTREKLEIKTPEQIRLMRAAGLVVAQALHAVRDAVAPGVTTAQLDAVAEEVIRGAGAVPSFIGVPGGPGVQDFPATLCTSINDQVVHGIPGSAVLREGDVVSIDCGAVLEGWHGDAAVTLAVGDVDPAVLALLRVCDDSLWHGLAAVRPGGRLSDVSAAVETCVRQAGDYGLVEDYVGHGIGTEMHMAPSVPNLGRPGRGPHLVPGLAIAVEPMVNLGTADTDVLADGWTVVTSDGRPSAHFEHTVAVTPTGPWVLTAVDGGRARLALLGVPVSQEQPG